MSRRKLLLADDSVTIQKVVNLTFADEGIEVFAVSDGNEAVDRLMEISPDLVMADVNMPGINGYRVCERIKQHEKFRNTPVILLVGSFEPFDEQEARRVGADDYLTKPFQSIRQLVNKVSDLLERSTATTAAGAAENGEAAPTPLENSYAETQEMPVLEAEIVEAEIVESEEDAPRYDGAGFDDELIQANSATGFVFDEAQKFASRNYVEPREEDDDDYGRQPFTGGDSSGIESAAPDEYASSAQEDYASAQPQQQPQETTYQTEITPSPAPQTDSPFDSGEDDDDLLELFGDDEFDEEEEEEAEVAATATETENLQPQAETGSESETSAESGAAFSETENYQSIETENAQASATENVESSEAFVVQPIEAEAVESAQEARSLQTAETENTYPAEPAESVQQQHYYYGEEAQTAQPTETENTQSNEAITAAGAASHSQLSPEMIDAIAQRVIEKLSENAVREIAWEVVPQQADLIIRKMVEEKLKE